MSNRLKRPFTVGALAALAVLAVVTLAFGSGGSNDSTYRVRAVFDDAFAVIPGLDVKIAGVKVGKVESLDLTADNRAAVVLEIENPGYRDFRRDASCTIRPQSLIGEKFIECTPTQPHAEGQPPAPELPRIPDGQAGAGQHLLTLSQTSSPVDLDLINNIMRRPYRERFALIINEFGTGLAGNAENLRAAIRRSNPALKQTDRVLKILADQNRVLGDLAANGDTVLAPLARERKSVAGFIEKAGETAQATAERRADLERSLERLPAFLSELKPTMERLGAFSDEMTPVFTDLRAAAPEINRFLIELGPFSRSSAAALETLGDVAPAGSRALTKARPVIGDLNELATTAKPVGANLAALLQSFKDSDGITNLMDFLFYQSTAINGFDDLGHYLRIFLFANTCTQYRADSIPANGCGGNFIKREAVTASKTRSVSAQVASLLRKNKFISSQKSDYALRSQGTHTAVAQGSPSLGKKTVTQQGSQTEPAGSEETDTELLDYLLGNGGGGGQ